LYALGAASIPFAEYAVDWFAPTPLALGSLSTTLSPAFLPLFGVFAVCVGSPTASDSRRAWRCSWRREHFGAVAGSLSLRSIAWKVGQVVDPVSVGALWDATSVFAAFFTASAFIAVAAVAFLGLYTTEPAPDRVPAAGD